MLCGELSVQRGEAASSKSICKLTEKYENFYVWWSRFNFTVGLAHDLYSGRHLVLLFPVQAFFCKEIWSIRSSRYTSAGTLVLDIHRLRITGHNQIYPAWCLHQKYSFTGIFPELFTISKLPISLTVTHGIKTMRYFCKLVIPYWKQHTALLKQGSKALLGCCNPLL